MEKFERERERERDTLLPSSEFSGNFEKRKKKREREVYTERSGREREGVRAAC